MHFLGMETGAFCQQQMFLFVRMAISHGRYSEAAISFATLQFAHFHTDDSADSTFQGIMVHLINRFVEKTGSSGHFDMLQIVVSGGQLVVLNAAVPELRAFVYTSCVGSRFDD